MAGIVAGGGLKVLFVMLHAGFVRNYDGVLRGLARDGHTVHVAFEMRRNKLGEDVQIERLAAEHSRITFGPAPPPDDSLRSNFARVIRIVRDYLRYLEPRYEKAAALRQRVRDRIPPAVRRGVELSAATAAGRRMLEWLLRTAEAVLPVPGAIERFLLEQEPDALVVTPLVDFGSDQVDYLKAARQRGIPSALAVASWDNLTNKGLMRVAPDRVLVWNEAQKHEAITLHGIDAGRIVVTGAQVFDHWFDWKPSASRAEFCRRVGLDADRPYILYLGSSFFIAPDEAVQAVEWIRAVRRAADPVLSSAGILIRPHPTNLQQWLASDLSRLENVALWPRALESPFTDAFKRDFFDSMYFSSAVCGVNTSALIEAGIVGRPVFTLLSEAFAHSQEGTLHFHHLVDVEGGLLHTARTLDAHLADIASALRGGTIGGQESAAGFVRAFVRPHGLDAAATPRVVRAMEDLAGLPAAPTGAPWPVRAAGWALIVPAWLTALVWRPGRKLGTRHRPAWWIYVLRPVIFTAVSLASGGLYVIDGTRAAARATAKQREALRRRAYHARRRLRQELRLQEAPKLARRSARRSLKGVRTGWKRVVAATRSGCRYVLR